MSVSHWTLAHLSLVEESRYNEVNIQVLSKGLHQQLFPECHRPQYRAPDNGQLVSLALWHLQDKAIPVHEARPSKPDISLNLPALLGDSIEEHFWRMGDMMSRPYYQMADYFANSHFAIHGDLSFMESQWVASSGWTKYSLTGEVLGQVPFPEEQVIVIDVETCPNFGPYPLLAVALSSQAIYGWISPLLLSPKREEKEEKAVERLIPLNNDNPTICIGHNISFDRACLLQEYSLYKGPRRFLDTLSIHCAVAGLSSQQRGLWNSYKKEKFTNPSPPSAIDQVFEGENEEEEGLWKDETSMNNLVDAVRLHCNGYELDKSTLTVLLDGSLEDVRANFHKVMTYCANDVAATYHLYRALWPKFIKKCPHPVTFAALLEMGTCFLPVNERWPQYIESCNSMYQQAQRQIEQQLGELVEEIVKEGQKDDAWRADPWLCKLDWTPVPAKYTKARYKADGTYAKDGEPRPIGNVALFGKPAWYKKIYSPKLGRVSITPKTRILPYLLRMSWRGYPVHFLQEHGWCFGVKREQEPQPKDAGTPYLEGDKDDNPHRPDGHKKAMPSHLYYRVPHHEHHGAKVGSLMAKHFVKAYEDGTLTTPSPIMRYLLQVNSTFSFWVGYRERIEEQFVIWQDEPGVQLGYSSGQRAGMILPRMITMGTVTRRAVDPTWMTATNAKEKIVGSELKSAIIAPNGYKFVGADVDSQELWISSLLGDAQFGFAGATAMGWMALQGDKADKTDLHSRTAQILGINRDAAKIFTYGRIYGAGVKHATQLLQKFNPSMSKTDAEKKARILYESTKGRIYGAERGAAEGTPTRYYVGGSETFMFNALERIANDPHSRTPTLGCIISDGLLSGHVKNDFMTSRVNWAVQSSGVDYLHMLVISMYYLIRKYHIEARLVITIHDEVRFLVLEKDQYRAALALQISNVWTRAMFSYMVGMSDLPLSVAFFSAIDFDHVLRKEVWTDCVTPSNLQAVAKGSTMDIYKLLANLGPDGLGPLVDGEVAALERGHLTKRFRPQQNPLIRPAKTTEEVQFLIKQMGMDMTQPYSKDKDVPPTITEQPVIKPSTAKRQTPPRNFTPFPPPSTPSNLPTSTSPLKQKSNKNQKVVPDIKSLGILKALTQRYESPSHLSNMEDDARLIERVQGH